MYLNRILKTTQKPELYEPGTATMWTDEHISSKLLAVHLDEDIDLASRKKTTINSTINWILQNVKDKSLDILDLGCGPGIYAEVLAQKGHHVTGVDFSESSINYAVNEANKKRLVINYINKNYLDLEFENHFDLVILIYTDFGALVPADREKLLSKIYKSLKPGGTFIFDVLSDREIEKKVTPKSWEINNNGFWKKETYLALSDSFLFLEHKVILYQHIIIDELNYDTYRFWTHFYNEKDLLKILNDANFHNIKFFNDVLPSSNLWGGDNVIFCITQK